jgi:putative hydrolase of the HAD superfamily
LNIKALVWDLEGVLLLTHEGSIPASVAKCLDAPFEAVHAVFHGEFNDRTDIGEFQHIDFWHHLLDTVGLPRSHISKLWAHLEEDLFIDRDLLEIVRQYRAAFKTAMVSNYSEVLRPMLESRWRVDGAFDEIIISHEVGLIKPMPEMFDLVLERLGCQPQEAVLIDDRVRNIEGARGYGMHAVLFENREQMLADLDKVLSRSA